MKNSRILVLAISLSHLLCGVGLFWQLREEPNNEMLSNLGMAVISYGMGAFFAWIFLSIADAFDRPLVAYILLKVVVYVSVCLGAFAVARQTISLLVPELATASGIGLILWVKLQKKAKSRMAAKPMGSGVDS